MNTLQRIDLNKKLGVFSHASHPHYDEVGNMLTVGMRVGLRGPEYVINKFPVIPRPDVDTTFFGLIIDHESLNHLESSFRLQKPRNMIIPIYLGSPLENGTDL